MENLKKRKELLNNSMVFVQRNTHWITGIIIAIISELYIGISIDGFRLSLAVAMLPVLLVTINREEKTIRVGIASAVCVFLLRFTVYSVSGEFIFYKAALGSIPGAFYYIVYTMLFQALVPDKSFFRLKSIIVVCFICDFIPNVLELFSVTAFNTSYTGLAEYIYLLVAACIRTGIALLAMGFARCYNWLLSKEEHEARYQSLYLMTTDLKNEIYFMKKNSEEIERVMGYAYNLCLQLGEKNETEEQKQLALKIATEVHEIKKDYFRIIQGMENQIVEQYNEENMTCEDLFSILRNAACRTIVDKKQKIRFLFSCNADFSTPHHYLLITVLKNLVTNAIEAIEATGKPGDVQVIENKIDNFYEFIVKDNGPGIPDSSMDNIFKVGFSTKFNYKTGNIYRGMGLPAVKMIVEEKLGGEISIINRFGGATFKVLIQEAMLIGGINEDLYN